MSTNNYVKNILETMFPNLIKEDINLILTGAESVINLIILKFNFTDRSDILLTQLKQNNDRDIKAIIQMILPFVNDTIEPVADKLKKLITLNELYTKKVDGNYYYTNSQYNRAVIINSTTTLDRPYTKEYFQDHLQMLLMSIEQASNKLYVNWTDIVPITMMEYPTHTLFRSTVKKISGKTIPDFMNNYIDISEGISTSDIYNTISNLLFSQIKNEKWLIYDLFIDKSTIPYIKYLDKVLELKNIHKKVSWSKDTESNRIKFKSSWEKFLNSNDRYDNTILVDFYFFFKKYHRNATQLISDGLLKDTSGSIDMEDDPCDPFSKKIISDAKDGLRLVPIEEIHTYFYDQIISLKRTWYYYLLYKKNITSLGSFNIANTTINITPKNIYNFSKSLTNETINGSYVELPRLFVSLPNDELLLKVKHRIYNVEHSIYHNYDWFNINCYYKRLYPNLSTSDYPKINRKLYETIQGSLPEIVFEAMIYAGHLSQIKPNQNITDKSLIAKLVGDNDRAIIDYQRKQMKLSHFESNRNYYENSAYYYLTGETYGQLPPIIAEKSTKKYFDFITSETIWQFTYAMDWVSQINFYHHFANNRVNYVTGSTGVGKSTQVPKLLLYALRIIDYNLKGKIVCTQPRISPTTGNAKAISKEMGVPVIEYSEKFKRDIHTSNYYIQYKHSEFNHTNNNESSYLRIVTDGTLLTELHDKSCLCKIFMRDFGYVIQPGNVYDIVIVDEAHEHNANMDIILTLMRDACYINNSLRLVIVSATMDDDEPIYRRYYRYINDNKLYPLSSYVKANIFDRSNMDRRIHISPPGLTTQFKIDDYYLSKSESDLINETNYLRAGIEKTINVVNSTIEGDVLLFMAGKSDILESVTEINKMTPSNVVCLPFYSEMSEEDKLFTENIATTLPNYTRYKEDVLLDKSEINRSVPKNTYKRSIIVATNVAEASITLPKLKYVIDTGYAKVNTYDPILGTNRLITLPISQSSSQQRKGRVGRVASGTVYYLYAKEKIINNKTMYKIADSDPTDLIIRLSKPVYHEPGDIFIDSPFNSIDNIKSSESYQLLKEIVMKQYYLIKGIDKYFYDYYGKDSGTFNIEQSKYFEITHEEHIKLEKDFFPIIHGKHVFGLDYRNIIDEAGEYFIIHPDENVMRRHPITGNFISLKLSDSIKPSYYYSMIKKNELDKILNIDIDNIYEKNRVDKIKLLTNSFLNKIISVKIINSIEKLIKLDILEEKPGIEDVRVIGLSVKYYNIRKIGIILNVDILNNNSNLLWVLHGIANNIDSDIIAVLTMITVVTSPINFAVKKYLDKFKVVHKNKYGDIYFYYKIWSKLKSIPQILNLLKESDISVVANKFAEKKIQYINNTLTNFDEYIIFKKLHDKNHLNNSDELYYYIDAYIPTLSIDQNILPVLKNFASANYLSYDLLIEFLNKFLAINADIAKKSFLSSISKKDKSFEILTLEYIKKYFIYPSIFNEYNEWYKFFETYLRTYFTNAIYRKNGKYHMINTQNTINISTDNMLDSVYPYIIYHTFDVLNDNSVSIISAVNIEFIIKSNPLYYSQLSNNSIVQKYLKQSDIDNYKLADEVFNSQIKKNLT